MKLFSQLTLLTVATAVSAIAIAFYISAHLASEAITDEVGTKLEGILDGRHEALTSYLSSVEKDLLISANSQTTREAVVEFSQAYAMFGAQAQSRLQHDYITNNPHSDGKKDTLLRAEHDHDYHRVHQIYHPYFRKVKDLKGLYDIFIFDTKGNLVYSVFKETDFATNLIDGPWQASGLGRVVQRLSDQPVDGALAFDDFSPYSPSLGAPASFVATPIFDLGKHIGTLAYQLPLDRINQTMRGISGLGESGETLLINSDKWLLSDSRFSDQSTVLKRQINTTPAKQALRGDAGVMVASDYRNRKVLSAFRQLTPFANAIHTGSTGDSNWAILSEIELEEALASERRLERTLQLAGLGIAIAAALIGFVGAISLTRPISEIQEALTRLSSGKQAAIPSLSRKDEIGDMARAADKFRQLALETQHNHWLGEHLGNLAKTLTESKLEQAPEQTISYLCNALNIPIGAIYLPATEDQQHFYRAGSFGTSQRSDESSHVESGEGLIGQCIKERRPLLLNPVPDGLAAISTGMARVPVVEISLYPIIHSNKVLAVLELGATQSLSNEQHQLLEHISQNVGVNFYNIMAAESNERLLVQSQAQTKALAEQQQELQQSNQQLQQQSEELKAQTEELRASEEELRANEEELKAQQEELTERNTELEHQRSELQSAQLALQQKAEQLEKASTYKSEFLANMSHELRTPLNSILILAKSLADNDDNSLSQDQTEAASVIHESGTTLLTLINDILDLSKIEAGKLTMHYEPFPVSDLVSYAKRVFSPVAERKAIELHINSSTQLPQHFVGDRQRLNQVLSNLLSNAIKFTENGSVTLSFDFHDNQLHCKVIDTGVGIASDKIQHIFGAFNQEDGSTSRKFGGTGLGLAITKKLIEMMGGTIQVSSEQNVGSEFVVVLPNQQPSDDSQQAARSLATPDPSIPPATPPTPATQPPDKLAATIRKILLVEDDQRLVKIFSRLISNFGYDVEAAITGTNAIESLERQTPDLVFLDLGLPDMSGLDVLRHIRQQMSAAELPVYIVSGATDTGEAKTLGAQGYLKKPVSKSVLEKVFHTVFRQQTTNGQQPTNGQPLTHRQQTLLVIEDDLNAQAALKTLLSQKSLKLIQHTRGDDALASLQSEPIDTIILDLGLADMEGIDWLKQAKQQCQNIPPVVIYSGRDLGQEELLTLREYTDAIVIKGELSSDRLLEEVEHSLSIARHPSEQAPSQPSSEQQALANTNILLVDDDVRNLYAISTVLRKHGATVTLAPSGPKALEQIDQSTFDIVLTDIMMPEMDGYQLIAAIRQKGLTALPIVALTAKAMQGDRENCIKRGANDYVSKPVDIDRLITVIQQQLHRDNSRINQQ